MPADDQQHAAEAPLEQQDDQCCVNCGVAGLPASCYRRHPLHGDHCSACYSYSSSRGGRARPEPLWQRQRHRMLEALDPNALRCTHCGRLPKEGDLFHKCRHPRNKRPLCGTCHHYAWRKDGLMWPWELVARDPHMRDDSGHPAQQPLRSGRPGTGAAAVAPSAAAASREETAAAAATGGGGHRARRGRPVREMSEAEQEAWHASWQLPAGYLPADAAPQRRRAAGRRRSGGSAGGQPDGTEGEDAADEEQQEQQGRRQLWQQLVAWDGEAEAGEHGDRQQQEGRQRVRPEDWEAPLHGARWEAPALPAAGRRRPAVGEAATGGEQQQGQRRQQRQRHGQQQQQQQQQQQEEEGRRQRLQQPALPPLTPQRPAQQLQQQQGEQARSRSQRQLALPAPPLSQQQSQEQGWQQRQEQPAAVQPPPQRLAQRQVVAQLPPPLQQEQQPQEQARRQQQQQQQQPQQPVQRQAPQQPVPLPQLPQPPAQRQAAQQAQQQQQPAQRQAAQQAQQEPPQQQRAQQPPQRPAQRQAPQRQQLQHAQQPPEPPAAERRPAARAPVAVASLGLQEADLFGDAVAARVQPSLPQPQRVLTVRRAAPVQAPSRSEMQALLQAEREAELCRVQQQHEAQMEITRQQRHHAAFGAGWSVRPARSGGSYDTWGAAARDNLQAGVEEEEEAGEDWQQAEWQEDEEEEGEEVQQPTEQAQRREAKRRRRQRQRWRRRQRRLQEEQQQQRQEEEEEEEECEEEQQGDWDEAINMFGKLPRPIYIRVSEEQVTAALEAELARGHHPELQPIPASLRRQLGVPNCRFAGRTVCVSGITEVVMDFQDEEARRERLEARVIAALTNCPETIEAVYLFRGAESTTWEADVRFVSAQDAARVLRFKLGLQMHGSPVTLRPDPDEVKYERHKLWRLKQMWVDDAIRTAVAAGDAALLARLQALKGP